MGIKIVRNVYDVSVYRADGEKCALDLEAHFAGESLVTLAAVLSDYSCRAGFVALVTQRQEEGESPA